MNVLPNGAFGAQHEINRGIGLGVTTVTKGINPGIVDGLINVHFMDFSKTYAKMAHGTTKRPIMIKRDMANTLRCPQTAQVRKTRTTVRSYT